MASQGHSLVFRGTVADHLKVQPMQKYASGLLPLAVCGHYLSGAARGALIEGLLV